MANAVRLCSQDGLNPELINTQTLISPAHESGAPTDGSPTAAAVLPGAHYEQLEPSSWTHKGDSSAHDDPLSSGALNSRLKAVGAKGVLSAPTDEGSEMHPMSDVASADAGRADPSAGLWADGHGSK